MLRTKFKTNFYHEMKSKQMISIWSLSITQIDSFILFLWYRLFYIRLEKKKLKKNSKHQNRPKFDGIKDSQKFILPLYRMALILTKSMHNIYELKCHSNYLICYDESSTIYFWL